MKHCLLAGICVIASALIGPAAHAEDTLKIGLIMPYSGQFADTATQMDDGLKLYLKQHGNMLAGKSVELIRKDVGGIAPPVAKRLAQELVTRDNIDILAGFGHTQCHGRRRRVCRGEEVHGSDECGHGHRHHQIALHGAGLVHRATAQSDARHLVEATWAEESLHDGDRLWSRH